ncbi:hypothetical protein, partial [Pseudomonas amygdali]
LSGEHCVSYLPKPELTLTRCGSESRNQEKPLSANRFHHARCDARTLNAYLVACLFQLPQKKTASSAGAVFFHAGRIA